MTHFILRTHTGKDVAVLKASDVKYILYEDGRITLWTKADVKYRCDLIEPTDKVN